MKRNSKKFSSIGIQIMLLLFLSLTTVCAQKSSTQQIKSMDSSYASLEGTQSEIDSVLKILNDYPDLIQELATVRQLLKDERKLTSIHKETIMKALDMDVWDLSDAEKRIKRIRRRLFWKPIIWGALGASVGATLSRFF